MVIEESDLFMEPIYYKMKNKNRVEAIYWPKGKYVIPFVGGSYFIFREQKFHNGKWIYGKWGWRYCESSTNHYFEVDERFDSEIEAKRNALRSGKVTTPFELIFRLEH